MQIMMQNQQYALQSSLGSKQTHIKQKPSVGNREYSLNTRQPNDIEFTVQQRVEKSAHHGGKRKKRGEGK